MTLGMTVAALAQAPNVVLTDAFPGTKFSKPVFFGPFPGRPGTHVVLEQHRGNVLLVTKPASGSIAIDTLYTVKVGQTLEQGLLGIAFHPDFATNHKYYLSYTPSGSPYYDIVEERMTDASGKKDAGTGRVLIQIEDPYENHNGGNIAFSPKDGFLYYAVGDGGGLNDPKANGQNVNSWLAKMHRIDVNSKDAGLEYHIPADNPFAQGGGKPETFAYGLRNPWRWSFDPVTGELWEGDVGEATWEEVNLIVKGGNYGWKAMEGFDGTDDGKMVKPLFTFDHQRISVNPNGPAIIGGRIFRGNPQSKLYGAYFMACYGTKRFWMLQRNDTGIVATVLSPTPTNLSSFGHDAEGRLYACGLNNGTIYLLDHPDLAPSSIGVRTSKPNRLGRYFIVNADGRLDASLFQAATSLDLIDLKGNRLATLSRQHNRLPSGLTKGVYLLHNRTGETPTQGLVVP
jgi:glucose/arabinose dehydrogenase